MVQQLPKWLTKRFPASDSILITQDILKRFNVKTVCDSAICPNLGECFSRRTVAFMIMGDICTRNCRFCAVETGYPLPLDLCEPRNLVKAVNALGLKHVVITSVSRDDLPDGGAGHFAKVVNSLRKSDSNLIIEVLTPDFNGDYSSVVKVLKSFPDIFNHNIETIPRLYQVIRPQTDYKRSLNMLRQAKIYNEGCYTKSGIMLGLGESEPEVIAVLQDLLDVGCDAVTIGQYMQPTAKNISVKEYIPIEIFEKYKLVGDKMGFRYFASGPFVRSSYYADDFSLQN